MNIML